MCSFLGVPVPGIPFPHVNEKADFEKMIKRSTLQMFATDILLPSAAAMAAACALGAMYSAMGLHPLRYSRHWRGR